MIECTHVYKKYKNGVNALYDINFSVEQGEFVYIIGPTGSGKSTLIKLLDGEEIPTKGKVSVVGIDVGKLRHSKVPVYRRNIGVVFQDFKLLPSKTVFENIAYALEVINLPKSLIRRRVREVMNLVGLDEKGNSFPRELSGGQQQRVAVARAIANRPKVLIADEPTGNLDPSMSDEVMNLLDKINREYGTTILMVTHDLTIVNKYRNVSPGRMVLITDAVIILSSLLVPSFDSEGNLIPFVEKITTVVYGFVLITLVSTVLDLTIQGSRQSVQLFVLSKHYREIADMITETLHRGVTVLDGKGWYTKENTEVLMVITRKYDLNVLLREIKRIDPNAFLSVSSVTGVYGKGFESIKGGRKN